MNNLDEDKKLLIVYGSLKKGKFNHDLLYGEKYLGETKVRGIMQLCGSYPYLFDPTVASTRGNGDVHNAEVYDVTDETYETICSMELGAGYYKRRVSTEWGDGIMFLTQPNLFEPEKKVVKEY